MEYSYSYSSSCIIYTMTMMSHTILHMLDPLRTFLQERNSFNRGSCAIINTKNQKYFGIIKSQRTTCNLKNMNSKG